MQMEWKVQARYGDYQVYICSKKAQVMQLCL